METTPPNTAFTINHVEKISKPERLAQLVLDAIENQWEMTRLLLAEKLTTATAALLSSVIVGVFSFFFIIFLSFGTAFWLGRVMDNMATGFFIVALFYLLALVFALTVVKPIIEKNITQTIINALDNEDEGR